MRQLVELLTIFDWITPLKGFIEDFYHDPTLLHVNSWTFFIPYEGALNAGYNAAMIESLLREYGIKYWGSQITNGQYFFSVPKNQARWAEYLIVGLGIPVDERSLGAPAPEIRPRVVSQPEPPLLLEQQPEPPAVKKTEPASRSRTGFNPFRRFR